MSSILDRRHLRAKPIRRERAMLARGIERVVEGPRGGGYIRALYPIIHPEVARAATPSLLTVVDVLRDERRDVAPAALASVREFLTRGATSPLYAPSRDRAAHAAQALARDVLEATTPAA